MVFSYFISERETFDFDDCGYGFFMYDLGCTLVTCSRDLEKLTDAWVEGYEKQRILSEEDKEVLPMFILLRRIVRLAWIASHPDSDTRNEMEPEYLDVTMRMAEKRMRKGW